MAQYAVETAGNRYIYTASSMEDAKRIHMMNDLPMNEDDMIIKTVYKVSA